ncbi:MAG: hypothetical protein JWL88_803 [Parcubacteria group bacterium]|nr:hypothetical protein [Parcubacteria group bacterium]
MVHVRSRIRSPDTIQNMRVLGKSLQQKIGYRLRAEFLDSVGVVIDIDAFAPTMSTFIEASGELGLLNLRISCPQFLVRQKERFHETVLREARRFIRDPKHMGRILICYENTG